MEANYLKGFLLTAFGVLILSFDALFIRLIDGESGNILFWRGLCLSVTVAISCKLINPQQALFRRDWRFIISTLLFSISSISFVMAINLTSVANVLVIISVQPLFAAFFSWLLLGEKSPLVTWLAIFIALSGIVWVLADSWQGPHLKGDLLALLCGLSLSCKFVMDRGEKKHSMIPTLIGSGIIMAIFGAFNTDSVLLDSQQWLWTFILCLVIVPSAFILITLGPKYIPAAEVGMLMLLETVVGPLWIWLFLAITPNPAALQGGSVVITTLIIHTLIRLKMSKNRRRAAM